MEIEFLGAVGERAQILRQTGTAERKSGRKIGWRNIQPRIGGENFRDFFRVDSDGLAQSSQLIRESHFHGVECVARIFDHFGGGEGCFVHGPRDSFIEISQRRHVAFARGAKHGERRVEEISESSPFANKFRVIENREIGSGTLSR